MSASNADGQARASGAPAKRDTVADFDFDGPPVRSGGESVPIPRAAAHAAGADPYIGRAVGNYLIEKRLTGSDRSDVYLAYHRELGTPVAVKLLRSELCAAVEVAEERFFAVAAERSAVQHPNILRLQEVGKDGSRYYLITEYVEGRRLEEVLDKEGVFSPDKSLDCLSQLCGALDELHEKGVASCGLNPYSVLVDKTGVLKAAVFGIGSVLAGQGVAGVEDRSLEAVCYLAPEQAEGKDPDARSDIYALGCMLYRMLCGRPPHHAGVYEEILRLHREEPAPDPRALVPSIPKEVGDLALRMMARDPSARPQTAREVLAAVRQAQTPADAEGEAAPQSLTAKVTYKGLEKLLVRMRELGSSDLHIKVNTPPVYRIRGETRPLNAPPFTARQIQALLYEALTPAQIETLNSHKSLDIAIGIEGVGRFRANVYHQRSALSACIRAVASNIPSMDQLLLPRAVANIAACKNGLALVSGATGSGKSTTLACIIDVINQTRRNHIITIEDPIEYVHQDKASIVSQREIGIDTPDFLSGLRDAMRQDPDVILIGELRDSETVETAMHASETGHLVLATLHAKGACDGLVRLLNFFPHEMHAMLRHNLGNSLRALVAQKLVAGCRPEFPRVPAIELLFVNPVIRQCIQDNEEDRIPKQFQVFSHEGLQSFNMSLYTLVTKGFVNRDIALQESPNAKELMSMFGTTVR